MLLIPRSYQIEAAHSFFSYFEEKKGNPIIAMPTGTGKSIVIAMILQMILYRWPRQRIMVLTHVKELIAQNHNKLMTLWPQAPAGIYSAGLNRKDLHGNITFAGIGSVAKKAAYFGHVDLVLIDEAHLVSPNEETLYQKFLSDLKDVNPYLKVTGFTATPWRLGTGKLIDDGIFTDMCFDITGMQAFNRLIAEGYISLLIPRQTKQMLDVNGVHMRSGEFIASELQAAVDKMEITKAALEEAIDIAADRRCWLVFASGVDHAIHISEVLNDMGIPAVAIHSKMGDVARDQAIRDLKSGKYRAAVNNNVLTTGFDHPPIDCIIVLRPTASTVLWVQMLGRGTRPFPGKENCLVLDFAGNTRRLGPINDPVIPHKKGAGGGEAPVKLCGSCATYNHASVRFCVYCGAEFTFQVKIQSTAADEQVIKGDMPVVDIFEVDHITFSKHQKMGRPPTLKVTYYCNLKSFSEYVCIEHDAWAQRKARLWWKDRMGGDFPEAVDVALERCQTLTPATHLRVWTNKQYPEILAYCFDGTAFGQQEPTGERPEADATLPISPVSRAPLDDFNDLDDDIPF
jgi:DNA repair protein RadD